MCETCNFRCSYAELGSLESTSYCEAQDPPAWVRRANQEEGEKSEDENAGPIRATVEEPCPKCLHPQLNFYTMQMRSADEGQTVFYECTKCQHKFSQNN